MAATLTVSPNPVPFTWKPIVTKSPVAATLTWDTDATAAGRVYEVVAGKEALVPGVPPSGAPKGSVGISLLLDQVRLFVLRRADATAAELARTTVKTQRPTLSAWLNDPDRQDIYDIKADVGAEEIRLRFRLRRPSAPFVNLVDRATGAPLQFFASNDWLDRHEVTLRGSFAALAPDRDYTVNIVADRSKPPADVLNDTATVDVHTGSRDVVVYFDRVQVRNDSDDHGSGEIQFEFGAGEVDGGNQRLTPGDPSNFWKGDPSSGDEIHLNAFVTLRNCRRWVWAQAFGLDDDTDWFGTYFTGGNVEFRQRGTSGRSDDDYDVARVTEWFDTDTVPKRFEQQGAALVPVATERPFLLWGGDYALAFHVHGRLSVLHRSGQAKVRGGRLGRVVRRPSSTRASEGLRFKAGDLVAKVVQDPHGATLVAAQPAPDLPQVVHGLPAVDGGTAATAAALTDDGVLHVFALDGAGCLLTAAGDPLREEADFRWTTLGGRFGGELVACADGSSAVVFAVALDGSVRAWESASASFDDLGGEVRSLVALAFPGHGTILLAVHRDGELLHKRRAGPGDWLPAGREWDRLGPIPEGVLRAQPDGPHDVVLNVVGAGEDVHVRLWADYPAGPPEPWRRIGTFSDLLRGRLEV
jgi:hypothetical protein